jgi:hypothetical protein
VRRRPRCPGGPGRQPPLQAAPILVCDPNAYPTRGRLLCGAPRVECGRGRFAQAECVQTLAGEALSSPEGVRERAEGRRSLARGAADVHLAGKAARGAGLSRESRVR